MDAAVTLEARVARLRDRVDTRLAELAPAPASPVAAAVRDVLLGPGKRVRPLLVLLAADALGGDEDAALDPACAVEMVHAASLVLDDLPCMDDAEERRGLPATHRRFGEAAAVLAAVALLNEAYGLIARAPDLAPVSRVQIAQVLARAVGLEGLVSGQADDLERGAVMPLASLADIHERKTGVLFSAAVRIGALVASAELGAVEALGDFGAKLGLAFQALDDLQDDDGDDGLATVVSLLGREGAREEARRRLQAARAALARGGDGLQRLGRYVDLMLQPREAMVG
jgi:geranylgeranyl diphosphate synthase type II